MSHNNFKNTGTKLTDTNETTLITATDSSVFIVSSIIISNTHATTDSTISIIFTDTSEATDFNILTNQEIKRTVSREVLSRPLVLENLDSLKAQASNANIFDILVSYLDRSRERHP
jgi:hypothetical protein